MRICYLTHDMNPETGCGRFSKKLIEIVHKINPEWEIVILTTEGMGNLNENPILYANKYRLLANFNKIRAIIKKCDLVHALDGFPYGVIAAISTLGLKKKLVITGAGTGAVKTLYRPIYSGLLKWAYKKADKVLAISRYTANEINKIMPELKIEVIPHGVEFNDFSRVGLDEPIEEIAEKKPYILTVGAVKKRKGFHVILPAFAQALKRIPNLNYVILGHPIGDEVYFSQLKGMIKSLGIENRVFIFGKAPNQRFLRQLYNNAELFCLVPQNIEKDIEGFGLVFLEAAASGLPIVAGRNSGAEEAVVNDENGLLVDPSDISEITKAIIKILSDENLKGRFSDNSVKLAKKMDWETSAVKYIQNYRLLFNL